MSLCHLEEKWIYGNSHFFRAADVEQLTGCKVGIPLIHNVLREVRFIGRVVSREDPVEILVDGLEMIIIAEVGVALPCREVSAHSCKDEIGKATTTLWHSLQVG